MEMGKCAKIAAFKETSSAMELVQPAARRQIAYLSKTHVERFFAAIPRENTRDRLLFDLIYRYGLRRKEAALIRRDAVAERIWIGRLKGGVAGEYPIFPATRRLLWQYFAIRDSAAGEFVFGSRQSGAAPLSPSTIYALFRQYAVAADLPAERRHPHVLRHSIAVHLMNAGWDIADVQDWLGHRDIKSTMVYAAITGTRREARFLEALRSGEIART